MSGTTLFGTNGADALSGLDGDDSLFGLNADDMLSGNGGADLLYGARGNDRLTGGDGADTLLGGAGKDVLTADAGADHIRYRDAAEGGDVVRSYKPREDVIEVSAAGFGGGLTDGIDLRATGRYVENTTGRATSAAGVGQFIFETDTGRVWWDADGAGGTKAVRLAKLSNPDGTPATLGARAIQVVADFPEIAPRARDDAAVTAEDTPVVIGVLANDADPEGDALTVAGVTQPGHGTVSINPDGTLRYQPVASFNGTDTFTYTVRGGAAGTPTAVVTVTVTVTPVDDAIAPINLADIAAGRGGFVIRGENAGDRAGTSVAGIADLNGDGHADIIIGAPQNRDTRVSSAGGAAYVVFGKADGTAVDLFDPSRGIGGFKMIAGGGALAGTSVDAIADLNGDGRPEILVGAPDASTPGIVPGHVTVVWGKGDGSFVYLGEPVEGPGGNAAGFEIRGETGRRAGFSVAPIGDVNGDGRPDLVIGADADNDTSQAVGQAYVVFGKPDTSTIDLSSVRNGIGGYLIQGSQGSSGFFEAAGWSVGGIGDLNGDGRAEVLVGAPFADVTGRDSGIAYVAFGKADGATISSADLAAGIGGFRIFGEFTQDYAGWSVRSIADLNGDGRPEILVGAYRGDINGSAVSAGAAYVVWGKPDTPDVNLRNVANGVGGFKIYGETNLDEVGYSLAPIGDLNGDGRPEILIGAPNADAVSDNAVGPGAAYVVWGKASGAAVNLDDIAAGVGGFKIRGASGDVGWAVSAVGDMNGDGRPEILVGAPTVDNLGPPSEVDAGNAYVVFSQADWIGAL